MRRRSGFTLVELLVAMAIGAVLLTLLAALLSGGRRQAADVETRSDRAAALRLGAELLREELRLAGAVPWPQPPTALGPDLEAWLTPALTLAASGASHAIGMRGLDHRVSAAEAVRDLVFEVGTDASGEPQLYRRPAGAARQPLVAGLEALNVAWVVTADGARLEPGEADGVRVAALGLSLNMAGERHEFVVELPARPLLRAGSGL